MPYIARFLPFISKRWLISIIESLLRRSKDDGCKEGEKLLRAWNTTEVHRLIDGEWRIVHSNWALTQSMAIASAS
jgi:hypothetical protein